MLPVYVNHDWLRQSPPEQIINAPSLIVNLPAKPKQFYRHGWQSWSLTTWQDINFQLPVQKPDILHPMQTDPLYANHPAPNGSWLGAARFDNGDVLLLGALGLDAHVALHGQSDGEAHLHCTKRSAVQVSQQLHGWYEAGGGDWFVGYGDETSVFARYAELLGKRYGKADVSTAPRVWCSWYSLYTAIDEPLLDRIFDELGDLPFDVLQVDDGWQASIGDWQANNKFPAGMEQLAAKIIAANRKAGLWLAPLIAVKSSRLFFEHPDWFLKDADGHYVSAGFNWGEPLFALDTTHPDVLNWLAALMKKVRTWGFDYLKLDFLYAGALPGKRHSDMPREAAFRQGLKVMREAMGPDTYLLTCGTPILPSLGLCDAIRVGPDVAREWESFRDASLLNNPTTPGTKNAIRTTVNRLWLKTLVTTDPDVAYFSSQNHNMNENQKRMLLDLALICGFKATSDLPQWLNKKERAELHTFLESEPEIKRTGRYTFKLNERETDFSAAILLPASSRGLGAVISALTAWAGNQGWIIKLLNKVEKRSLEKMKKNL